MSANVAIQAGAPASQAGHSSFFFFFSLGSSASASSSYLRLLNGLLNRLLGAIAYSGSWFSSAIDDHLDATVLRASRRGTVIRDRLAVC